MVLVEGSIFLTLCVYVQKADISFLIEYKVYFYFLAFNCYSAFLKLVLHLIYSSIMEA